MIRSKTIVAFTVAAALAGVAAQAGEELDGPRQVNVYLGDLDLAHPAGSHTMMARVEAAAVQVCGGLPNIRVLPQKKLHHDCVAEAVEKSVAQLRTSVGVAFDSQSSGQSAPLK